MLETIFKLLVISTNKSKDFHKISLQSQGGLFNRYEKKQRVSKSVYRTHLNRAANIVLTAPKLERSSSRSSFSVPTTYIPCESIKNRYGISRILDKEASKEELETMALGDLKLSRNCRSVECLFQL